MNTKHLRFLLVQANSEAALIDQLALEETWGARGFKAEVLRAADGLAALRYLERVVNPPDIIITALDLPLLSGCRLIGLLKNSTLFRTIPIIVLSQSDREEDKQRAFLGGCAGYFVRSSDQQQFLADLQVIADYWALSKRPHPYA